MRGHTWRLAWRYLAHHRVRTAILVLCIALVFFLPVAVQLLVDEHTERLAARAAASPLLAGAKGSRYDLVLNALYFTGRVPDPVPLAEFESLRDRRLCTPIPLLVRHTARGYPIVGTTPDYFGYRHLRPERGTPPLVLGDAVLGAEVARELGLGPGDRLLSDHGGIFDLSLSYPLRMHITGVLRETGTPDDRAVFTDIKTGWVLEGLYHGHQAAEKEKPAAVLERKPGEIVLDASVTEYQEITPGNLASFHVHANPEELPLTAVLVVPDDARAATLLKGYYRVSEHAQLLVPSDVVAEILGFVFRIKAFFDANLALVTVATALFLGLIVLLSLRVRKREMETLFKIGCARLTVLRLQAAELTLVLATGVGIAALAAWVLVAAVLRRELPV